MPASRGTGLPSHGTPPATRASAPSSMSLSLCPSGSVKAMRPRPPRSSTPPCSTPSAESRSAQNSSAPRPKTLSSVAETSPAPAWFGAILRCGQSKNVTSVPGRPNSSP
jgi:hypothetical protein